MCVYFNWTTYGRQPIQYSASYVFTWWNVVPHVDTERLKHLRYSRPQVRQCINCPATFTGLVMNSDWSLLDTTYFEDPTLEHRLCILQIISPCYSVTTNDDYQQESYLIVYSEKYCNTRLQVRRFWVKELDRSENVSAKKCYLYRTTRPHVGQTRTKWKRA